MTDKSRALTFLGGQKATLKYILEGPASQMFATYYLTRLITLRSLHVPAVRNSHYRLNNYCILTGRASKTGYMYLAVFYVQKMVSFYFECIFHYLIFIIAYNKFRCKRLVHVVLVKSLKVHKRENFLGFDFEISTFS
jgi:hypothetical protein